MGKINGSRNWINLGSAYNLQNFKISFNFYLSYIINRRISSSRDYHLKHMIPPLGVLGVGLLLVLMQGDLGGTLLTVAIIASILIYSDIKIKLNFKL